MSAATATLRVAGAAIEFEGASLEAIADLVADQLEQRGVSEPEPWLTVEEAAAYWSCKPKRIYDQVAARKGNPGAGLEYRVDGRRLLFRREWLDEALERP